MASSTTEDPMEVWLVLNDSLCIYGFMHPYNAGKYARESSGRVVGYISRAAHEEALAERDATIAELRAQLASERPEQP